MLLCRPIPLRKLSKVGVPGVGGKARRRRNSRECGDAQLGPIECFSGLLFSIEVIVALFQPPSPPMTRERLKAASRLIFVRNQAGSGRHRGAAQATMTMSYRMSRAVRSSAEPSSIGLMRDARCAGSATMCSQSSVSLRGSPSM